MNSLKFLQTSNSIAHEVGELKRQIRRDLQQSHEKIKRALIRKQAIDNGMTAEEYDTLTGVIES